MPTFRLSENKARVARPTQRSARVPVLKKEEEQGPFYVRGEQAGSKDEYWVSLVLEKIEKRMGWGWSYQVPLFGGRSRRGGLVVDFLVYTPVQWTVLDPMGRYWHTGKHEDRDYLAGVLRRRNWRLIAWYTDQTPTLEAVQSFLWKELGVI